MSRMTIVKLSGFGTIKQRGDKKDMTSRPIAFYTEIQLADGLLRIRMATCIAQQRHSWNTHHISSDYELHILLEGIAKFRANGRERTLCARQGVLIPPDTPHIGASIAEWFDHFYVHFDVEGEKLRETLRNAVTDCIVFPLKEDIVRLAQELVSGIESMEPYAQEILYAQMQQIVLLALRHANIVLKTDASGQKKNEKQEWRNLVEEFFLDGMPFGTEKKHLAKLLRLSERQTLRFLQDNYGMTFDEKLRQFRMERSGWQLRETDHSVQVIAEKLRFKSLSSFYKAFQKWYGMTPGEYRERSRQENFPNVTE